MKTNRISTQALFALVVFGLIALPFSRAAAPKADAVYIQKVVDGEMSVAGIAEVSGKKGWWARSWSKTDGEGFFGRPKLVNETENADTYVVTRYTRYSTEYDVEFHSPVWGAYTIDKTTVANEAKGDRPASNPDFRRPSKFFQEPLVVAASHRADVLATSHGTFTITIDPRFQLIEAGGGISEKEAQKINAGRIIQRGHMVPNNAMKYQGTNEQGQVAQLESFTVANIVPQPAKSNSPSWASLESACFDWAKELSQVWLISGPIYRDREHPIFIKKVKTGSEEIAPSPEQLYYVVIGKRNGKTSPIGFIMPNEPVDVDFTKKAVPVSEIEKLTGINFMPDLGEHNPIEASFDPAWLQTTFTKHVDDEDN